MSNSEYETAAPPSAGDRLNMEEVLGSLVIIEPHSYDTYDLPRGETAEGVRANVSVVDGDQAGRFYEDTVIWGKIIRGQLKPKIGKKVLGRIGQGNKKPGQNAPWILTDPTDADIKAAKAFEAKQNPFDTATAAPPF